MLTRYIPCARHCPRHQGCSGEQDLFPAFKKHSVSLEREKPTQKIKQHVKSCLRGNFKMVRAYPGGASDQFSASAPCPWVKSTSMIYCALWTSQEPWWRSHPPTFFWQHTAHLGIMSLTMPFSPFFQGFSITLKIKTNFPQYVMASFMCQPG